MNKKIQIYIVEDDPVLSMDLSQCLVGLGYEVIGSSDNAEEAVENILRIKPDFVFMDINLKGKMDGVQAAAEIASHLPIPLAFLTGVTDEETLQRAKLTLPYGYIVKPYDPNELRSTIELTLFRIAQSKDPANVEAEREVSFEVLEGDISGKVEVLSQLECFRDIPQSDLTTFAEGTSIRSIEAGTFIRTENEGTNSAGFILLSGKISIMKSSVSGKELIVSLLGAGDIFGIFYLLKDFSNSCAARAQVNSRILWIPEKTFRALKTKVPSISNSLCSALAQHLADSYQLASGLAHSRVEDRIVTAILTLLPRLGHATANVNGNSRLFMTRKELADLTGTTPETAIRVTKTLERQGYLDLTRPGIIKVANMEGLQLLVADQN